MSESTPAWHPPTTRRVVIVVIALFASGAAFALLAAWRLPPFAGGAQTTENAYVRGRTAVIAPQVSGYVVEVCVKDYEHVLAGQALVRIDDRIYRARVEQARANLDDQLAALAEHRQGHASRTAGSAAQRPS